MFCLEGFEHERPRNGSMISSFLVGLLMSFFGSIIPTGPISLIVLKRGLRCQKLGALSLASGAAIAEAGYALLAYFGIHFALSRYPLEAFILQILAGGILIAFAILCIFDGYGHPSQKTSHEYPGANFLLGLSIAGLNPTFLVTWVGAVAVARGAGLISDLHAAPAFALGVILGPILWFWILIRILNHHAGRLSPETLRTIEKALPIVLLILAGIILGKALLPFLHHG
jgi:threonine/homoserine/homoserine lactone efflux protein